VEFLNFLLPLWAASQLGASAFAVGAIVSAEAAVSLLARPLAGALSDRRDKSRVAAVGAGLYAFSFVGYAAASGVAHALLAAAAQGAGAALFWVAVRSRVGEEAGGSRSYGKLLSWESSGAFFGFVVGFFALGGAGYRGVFLLAACACALAAGVLALDRDEVTRSVRGATAAAGTWELWRRFWPLLTVVGATATAEAGIGVLLLLHLQGGFGLSVYEVAYVFLPGGLMFVILPEYAHKVTDRLGRSRTMILSLLASGALALSLSFAPSPPVIAALWALSAACLAAVIPVEQSTIAEAAGSGSVGRGMGLYESAILLGTAVGPALFGALYGSGGWQIACLVMAAVLTAGAVAVPFALRSFGLPERPSPSMIPPGQEAGTTAPPDEPSCEPDGAQGREPDSNRARKERRRFYEHGLLFVVGQAILFAVGESWPEMLLSGELPPRALWTGELPENASFLVTVSRVWCIVLIVDGVWSLSYTLFPNRGKRGSPGRGRERRE
jgi:MFS family permease